VIELVDTHCHIHFGDYGLNPDDVITAAKADGVTRLLCVGCTLEDSQGAVDFVQTRENTWATIGLHPHEGAVYVGDSQALKDFESLANKPKVVAIGECGLDYYYNHSSKEQQRQLLEFQLHLAQKYDLPLIFHVRDSSSEVYPHENSAFHDFLTILSHFEGVRGVVHSFTANVATLDKLLDTGLYIGLNGIMTFTKDPDQLAAAKSVPLDRLLLETDAPFLTPKPYRGTICQPKHVREVGEFLAKLRSESLEKIAAATTRNARELFKL
jgi:TatD DNase family protein